jgi:hypothetical protein
MRGYRQHGTCACMYVHTYACMYAHILMALFRRGVGANARIQAAQHNKARQDSEGMMPGFMVPGLIMPGLMIPGLMIPGSMIVPARLSCARLDDTRPVMHTHFFLCTLGKFAVFRMLTNMCG